MYNHYSKALLKAIEDMKITIADKESIEELLTDEEYDLLGVIIKQDRPSEYKLYIREMCKYLDKRDALPTKYLRLLSK